MVEISWTDDEERGLGEFNINMAHQGQEESAGHMPDELLWIDDGMWVWEPWQKGHILRKSPKKRRL